MTLFVDLIQQVEHEITHQTIGKKTRQNSVARQVKIQPKHTNMEIQN